MKNNLKKLQTDLWEIVQFDTQGKRSAMEDFSDFLYPFTSSETSLLLSVFDGHAGHRCANFLVNTLPTELKKETLSAAAAIPSEDVFKKIFKSLDQMWLDSASKKEPRIEDGSTGLCVALDCSDIIIANCGDCRAILSQAGQTIALTRDHKPSDESEQQRIVNQGGTVIGGRLQGQLAVSRAFGNYEYKEAQILSSEPEIHHISLTSDVEYLVVGSDGLYEHFTNEEIISFIKNGLNRSNNPNLEMIVKELVEEAIDRGSGDNITILVVKFEKAFKKLLKKKAKKQQPGKSTHPAVGPTVTKNNPPKSAKITVPDFPTEPKTSLFKKGQKLGKNTLLEVSPKKKSETAKKLKPSVKLSSPRLDKPYKPFKYDFFGSRTPVTISG
jgi:serine/threonine protein phosphatase PrpC